MDIPIICAEFVPDGDAVSNAAPDLDFRRPRQKNTAYGDRRREVSYFAIFMNCKVSVRPRLVAR